MFRREYRRPRGFVGSGKQYRQPSRCLKSQRGQESEQGPELFAWGWALKISMERRALVTGTINQGEPLTGPPAALSAFSVWAGQVHV